MAILCCNFQIFTERFLKIVFGYNFLFNSQLLEKLTYTSVYRFVFKDLNLKKNKMYYN